LSSAILYLAIVAIWACVLVPRWLRRSHDNHSEQEGAFEQEEFAEGADPEDLGAAVDPDADPVAWEDQGAVPADPVAWEDQGAVPADPVAWDDPDAVPADPESDEAGVHAGYSSVSYSMTTTLSVESVSVAADDDARARADAAAQDDAQAPYDRAAGDDAAAAYGAAPAYDEAAEHGHAREDRAAVGPGHAGQDWSVTYVSAEHQYLRGSSFPPGSPGLSPGRARVLQARRRLLTMLVALTIGTAACTVAGFMPWLVLIVPIGLLGLYLLLLREAAQADAENARRQAEAHARAVRAERARALREQAREAAALAAQQRTAQVINLTELAAQYGESSRRDQPYDQYTDAEMRAVGD